MRRLCQSDSEEDEHSSCLKMRRAAESSLSPVATTRKGGERLPGGGGGGQCLFDLGLSVLAPLRPQGLACFSFFLFSGQERRPAVFSVTPELNSPQGVQEVK